MKRFWIALVFLCAIGAATVPVNDAPRDAHACRGPAARRERTRLVGGANASYCRRSPGIGVALASYRIPCVSAANELKEGMARHGYLHRFANATVQI